MNDELEEINNYLEELRDEATFLQRMVDEGDLSYPTEHSMGVLEREIAKVEKMKLDRFRYVTKWQCLQSNPKSLDDKNGKSQVKHSNPTNRPSTVNEMGDNCGAPEILATPNIRALSLKDHKNAEISILSDRSKPEDKLVSDVKVGAGTGDGFVYRNLICNEKITIEVQIYFPVKHFPWINFSGPFIGPNGKNIKKLQELTRTKMAVLGKGFKGLKAEGDQREDPYLESVNNALVQQNEDDKLHVWIQSSGIPANAYLKMALAISEVTIRITTLMQTGGKKWPSPKAKPDDNNDNGCKFMKRN